MQDFSTSVMHVRDHHAKLTVDQLAEALYEGLPHLQNLAEKLARQHGQAQALTFYGMNSDDVRNFWRGIAKQRRLPSRLQLGSRGSLLLLVPVRILVSPRRGLIIR